MNVRDIEHGWDVYGADDEKVGDVAEVEDTYIVLSKGLFFPSERYIPTSAITRVEHDRVYLNLTKDEVKARDWDPVQETGTRSDTAGERRERTTEPAPRREGGERVQLREEELRVSKEWVEAGEARIVKEVVTEEKTLDVPVMHEQVTIDRRAGDGRPADRPIGDSETIEVPVYKEQVDVDKQAVVYEELSIGKRQLQETERVTDTVRREEARIEGEGDVDVRGDEPRRQR